MKANQLFRHRKKTIDIISQTNTDNFLELFCIWNRYNQREIWSILSGVLKIENEIIISSLLFTI